MIGRDSSHLIAHQWPLAASAGSAAATRVAAPTDDLFEQTAWLYAFFREHLFRDDTERILQTLWPDGAPPPGALLLEVGCGPGLYARRLADRCPGLRTVGVDRSWRLLDLARERAAREGNAGCRFEHGDALALDWPDESVDAVVASRLFTVVDGAAALAELYRVLRPGGHCFVAEPASTTATLATMLALRLAGWLTSLQASRVGADPVPRWPNRLSPEGFLAIARSRQWSELSVTLEQGYHYAVGVKAGAGTR
jgi:arsenite methyltransferase